VPDGEHDVVLQNRPRGQRIGLLVSVATVLLLAAAIAGERWLPAWRRRRQATP
jgi:hypothetical protein